MIYKQAMRRYRQAKIVATLGPSSDSPAVIRALFDAGADVFRLNFSHGTHQDHAERFAIIRALEAETRRPIGILTDLQGPKLRVGDFAGGKAILTEGTTLRLDLDETARLEIDAFARGKFENEFLDEGGDVAIRAYLAGPLANIEDLGR